MGSAQHGTIALAAWPLLRAECAHPWLDRRPSGRPEAVGSYCDPGWIYDTVSSDNPKDIFLCKLGTAPRYYANHVQQATWLANGGTVYLHETRQQNIIYKM